MEFRSPIENSASHLPNSGEAHSRIVGEGEMAELIRAFDWETTPLGSMQTWSETLVTTVNLILASRHPMFLWWGPELIQFYNDAYRPSIGRDKHPSAVGQRGTECWPEIWPIIGPHDGVMNLGRSTWNANHLVPIYREGNLEEVYWTYGYSPVRDRNGIIQGTLVVCTETTDQVLSERRLRALLAIAIEPSVHEQLAESRQWLHLARAIVGNLSDYRTDFPFASLFLFYGTEIIGAGGTAATDRLSQADNWPLLNAVRSQTPVVLDDLPKRFGRIVCPPWPEPVTRAYLLPLALPGSPIQAVLVCGISPRLPFDTKYETFFQLVGTRIASLLHSEIQQLELAEAGERFTRLAEANPFGMIIGDLSGKITYMNPQLLQTLGYSEEDMRSGRLRWDRLTPRDFAELDATALRQLLASGRCEVYEKTYVTKDGRRIPILLGASVIGHNAGVAEIAAFVTDLTQLKDMDHALQSARRELEEKVRTSAEANRPNG